MTDMNNRREGINVWRQDVLRAHAHHGPDEEAIDRLGFGQVWKAFSGTASVIFLRLIFA